MEPNIEMFFSKSKDDIDSDVLGLGIRDWRKRLSNFWPSEVKVAFDANQPPKTYPSVEHAFHAGKAALCSDKPAMAHWFEKAGAGGREPASEAKKRGAKGVYKKENAALDVLAWDRHRDTVTMNALCARMETEEQFRAILRATRERGMYLLHFERQGVKSYWGGNLSKETGAVVGRNRLGEMLMELRENV